VDFVALHNIQRAFQHSLPILLAFLSVHEVHYFLQIWSDVLALEKLHAHLLNKKAIGKLLLLKLFAQLANYILNYNQLKSFQNIKNCFKI